MKSTADLRTVRCPSCGALNRVADERMDDSTAAVCGRCRAPLPRSSAPLTVTDANFAELVESSPEPVLLDLWAAWCGPCRILAPVVEQLASELAGSVRVGKLEVDENPRIAARYDVRSIPTLLVLRAGREVDRIVGALPKTEILRRVRAALGRSAW